MKGHTHVHMCSSLPQQAQAAWFGLPALLLVGCGSLDKSLNLSGHPIPHLVIKIISAL